MPSASLSPTNLKGIFFPSFAPPNQVLEYFLVMKTLSKLSHALMILVLVVGFLGTIMAFSQEALAKSKQNKKKVAQQQREAPHPANASILIDADTGMIISQSDADRVLYPASLTKLMTLALTFEALDSRKISLSSRVVMTSHAASMPPSKIGLRPGESLSVDQAIKALVTKSANDVAVALGEKLGGSEARFARIMNLKARELGMNQTYFVNACGLHNIRQTSSARDMSKLALHILSKYPHYYPVFSTKDFYFNGRSYHNHNRLMSSYRGMDGMKTGYVAKSGFNLVASARRGNVRLVGVVFGGRTADSRNAQMANLLDDGFAMAGRLRQMRPQTATTRNDSIQSAPQKTTQSVTQSTAQSTSMKRTTQSLEPPKRVVTSAPPRERAPILTSRVATPAPQERLPDHILAPSPPPVSASSFQSSQPAIGNEGWSVQIGAFQDRLTTDQAIYRAIQKLPSPLNRGNPMIIPLRTAEATWMFRARISGYTREQAMQACRYLDDCLTISPTAN